MPKILNNGRLTENMQRAFGFKGRYRPLLDEVIVPVYQIADPLPSNPPRTAMGTVTTGQPSGAGLTPGVKFINPVASGVNVQLTSINVGSTDLINPAPPATSRVVGAGLFLTNTTPFEEDGQTPTWRDRRVAGVPVCNLSFSNQQTPLLPNVYLLTTFVRTSLETAELIDSGGEIARQPLLVLDPGQAFAITLYGAAAEGTGGLPLTVNFLWAEVPINQGPQGSTP